MLWNLIWMTLYVITSFTLFRELFQFIINHLRKDKSKILLYPFDFKNVKFILSFIFFSAFLVYAQNSFDWYLYITIVCLYVIHHMICAPDENDVLESNNLHIGYLAAEWYYKNYLTLFLPDFIQRVKTFESFNKVHVQKKLFILVPESCRVLQCLDDETDCIERCRELPKYKKTNSGIKNRTYNITVYHIKTERIRLAVEYASPLKGLLAFKRRKLLTEDEMLYQRKLFIESLQKFLKDENESYKLCAIVIYNDEERKLSDVLIEHCRLGNSVFETV